MSFLIVFLVGQVIFAAGSYPEKPITLIVPWSVGGMTDLSARTMQPILQEILKVPIVVNNMPGGSGAVGTEFVANAKADGYTILFSAETPATFDVLELSSYTFEDFNPLIVLTMGIPSFCVHKDAKWQTIEEILEDARKRPGEIVLAHSGLGASSHINSMMLKAAGIDLKAVAYSGGGPAVTAVLQREVDVTCQLLPEVSAYIDSGDLRLLSTFTNERTEFYPDVPALGEVLPEIRRFLPWGTFYVPCTLKGTPEEVNEVLLNAFTEAVKDPRWIEQTKKMCALTPNYTGEEALKFIQNWRSITSWLLYEGGIAKKSPAELGIPKP
jgi:tripartite-type tricarboxylate transporter receptor subunit TctC